MINRMTGYQKNDADALNFFKENPSLKLLMGKISEICFAERHNAKVILA